MSTLLRGCVVFCFACSLASPPDGRHARPAAALCRARCFSYSRHKSDAEKTSHLTIRRQNRHAHIAEYVVYVLHMARRLQPKPTSPRVRQGPSRILRNILPSIENFATVLHATAHLPNTLLFPGSAPYPKLRVLGDRYDDGLDGARLEYADNITKHRAQVRSNNLTRLGDSR